MRSDGFERRQHAHAAFLQLLRIALEHFVAQHGPDLRVQFDEARMGAHLGHVARARQVDRELADRMRRRPGRQHHHAVAHRDGFVQVVRDEQHRLLLGGPQVEHFVFHQLPGLDVERGEGLVHQDDVGVQRQRLRQRRALAHAARQLVRIAVAEAAPGPRAPARPRACARASASGTPRYCRPTITLSSALRQGISASVWNM